MKPGRILFILLLALTAVRLFLIGRLELSSDEAYYTLWSQRLDWAYYSKGPGIALVIRAGTALFGETEFGVRFFSPLLSLGTSLVLFALGRRMHGAKVAAWAVLLLNATPIFNVGSLLMTIDPLSIFFWTCSLYALWRAFESPERTTVWWPLAGTFIGLGFLCKYTALMLLPSVILFLALSKRHRAAFRNPGFYLLLLPLLAALIPPVVWNMNHDWITLAHLKARGKLDSAFSIHPGEFFEFLGAHFGVYSPLLFAGILVALFWAIPRSGRHPKERFHLCFSLPLLALYFFLSLKEAGEANWTAPAFLSAGLLVADLWMKQAQTSRFARIFSVAAIAVGIVMSLLVVNLDLLRQVGIALPYAMDPSARLRGWETTAQEVEKIRAEYEQTHGEKVFLIANRYQTAASLAFYMKDRRADGPGHPPVYIPESQFIQNQFSFWPSYDTFIDAPVSPTAAMDPFTEQKGINPFLERTALYITDRTERIPAQSIKNSFEHCELLEVVEIKRRGLPLRAIRIFACRNYQTLPL